MQRQSGIGLSAEELKRRQGARERAREKEEQERQDQEWKLAHPRSLAIYIILLLLFGTIGLHDFYAGRIAGGIFQIIVGSILILLTAITLGIGLILLIPWSLLCFILGLCHLKDVDGVPMR